MRILALDIATNTGVAHSDGTLEKWRLVKGSHPGSKLLGLAKRLAKIYRERPFDYLAVELSAFGSGNMQRTRAFHNNMLGVALCFAASESIEFLDAYQPAKIKKFATGSGKATKEDMVRAAIQEGAEVGEDDDLADAFFVLRLAQHELRKRKILGS